MLGQFESAQEAADLACSRASVEQAEQHHAAGLLIAAVALVHEGAIRLGRRAREAIDDPPHVGGEMQQRLGALGADGPGHHLVPEPQPGETVGVQQARHRDAMLGLDAPGAAGRGERVRRARECREQSRDVLAHDRVQHFVRHRVRGVGVLTRDDLVDDAIGERVDRVDEFEKELLRSRRLGCSGDFLVDRHVRTIGRDCATAQRYSGNPRHPPIALTPPVRDTGGS